MDTTLPRSDSVELPIEDDAFWKRHAIEHKASGLSRIKYCAINHIHYGRFDYWLRKNKKKASPLVTVKIKSPEIPSRQLETLCTLYFSRGGYLQVHNDQSLMSILEKLV